MDTAAEDCYRLGMSSSEEPSTPKKPIRKLVRAGGAVETVEPRSAESPSTQGQREVVDARVHRSAPPPDAERRDPLSPRERKLKPRRVRQRPFGSIPREPKTEHHEARVETPVVPSQRSSAPLPSLEAIRATARPSVANADIPPAELPVQTLGLQTAQRFKKRKPNQSAKDALATRVRTTAAQEPERRAAAKPKHTAPKAAQPSHATPDDPPSTPKTAGLLQRIKGWFSRS